MKIIALDLSLNSSGWARAVAGLSHDSGVLTPPRSVGQGLERLAWVRDRALELAEGAELAVLEGYALGSARGASRSHALGELGGVVRLALHEAGVPIANVSPASLKKFSTGVGNGSKELVLVAAVKRLGFEGHDNNQADALWLLHMALDRYGCPGRVEVPKAHREALTKVPWPELAAVI